jgi:hypothetical protein
MGRYANPTLQTAGDEGKRGAAVRARESAVAEESVVAALCGRANDVALG